METQSTVASDPDGQLRTWPWKKAKKVAVMLSFCGKNYLGMQRNVGFKTIEEELMRAFEESGSIPKEWFECSQKALFQRASRTDKGVSAAKMIVSLKLLCDQDTRATIDAINTHLPSDIRVQAIKRVTKNFNCKSACDARTYLYVMPTFAFAPIFPGAEQEGSQLEQPAQYQTRLDFRISPVLRTKVNEVLASFLGAHYFHNYTSGKLPLEPSSLRFITEFTCGEPFLREGMEFVILKVKGQSFMLHQIRKMVGMAISVVRGHASMQTIQQSWDLPRIDIPRAPGLGLLLEEVHYDRYNKRFGQDGIHEPLTWENEKEAVNSFKEAQIFPEMIEGEIKEMSMFEWLKFLPLHTFSTRHFESDISSIEPSPLRQAKRRVQPEEESDSGKRAKADGQEEEEEEEADEQDLDHLERSSNVDDN